MTRFLKWFFIVIAFLVATFFIGGFLLPSKWSVSENITIKAPTDAVYAQIANLKNWQSWSPWTKEKDPTQEYTYEGPESGVGAKWLWTSEKMGKGWLEIKEADVNKGIAYELFIDMGRMQSTMHGEIAYTSTENGLDITWTDQGDSGSSLSKRWMSLLIKPMLRGEMKQGLTKLKSMTESK